MHGKSQEGILRCEGLRQNYQHTNIGVICLKLLTAMLSL